MLRDVPPTGPELHIGHQAATVGLPRKAKKGDPTPGWEDVRHMKSGTVERTILDDTLPGGPRERKLVYEAPFDRCDREQDYQVAWAHFEERFGNEGAP